MCSTCANTAKSLFSSAIVEVSEDASQISYIGLYFAITLPLLLMTLGLLVFLEKGLFRFL